MVACTLARDSSAPEHARSHVAVAYSTDMSDAALNIQVRAASWLPDVQCGAIVTLLAGGKPAVSRGRVRSYARDKSRGSIRGCEGRARLFERTGSRIYRPLRPPVAPLCHTRSAPWWRCRCGSERWDELVWSVGHRMATLGTAGTAVKRATVHPRHGVGRAPRQVMVGLRYIVWSVYNILVEHHR